MRSASPTTYPGGNAFHSSYAANILFLDRACHKFNSVMSAGDLQVVKVAMQLAANMSTGDKTCTSALWRAWWPDPCEWGGGALSGTSPGITQLDQRGVVSVEIAILSCITALHLWTSCSCCLQGLGAVAPQALTPGRGEAFRCMDRLGLDLTPSRCRHISQNCCPYPCTD